MGMKTVELRQTLHERILTTFEARLLAGTSTRHLSFRATTGSLPLPGGNTTANALW
jgi:hypothetical protein